MVLDPSTRARAPAGDRLSVRGVDGEIDLDSATFRAAAHRVADLMAVCDAGAIMPPKSTWFEPKLRDGLLIHPI